MDDIILTSESILATLVELRQEGRPINCWLRQKNDERMRRGQWFPGSHYIHIGLVKRNDWRNRTRQLGLVVDYHHAQTPQVYLDLVFRSENEAIYVNFYNELSNAIGLEPRGDRCFRKTYDGACPLSVIREFFGPDGDWANVMTEIEDSNLSESLLVSDNDFDESLFRVNNIRNALNGL